MTPLRVDEELEIVPWRPEHAEAMFAAVERNRGYLRQWLPWLDHVKTLDDERAFITRCVAQEHADNGFHAGVWRAGRIVGTLGFHYVDRANRKTEIGYWVDESEQGRGIATRCCRAACDLAFGEWKLNRVVIFCATRNERSRAVPERLGFTLEGVYRQAEWLYDHFVDLAAYAMLAADWQRRGGAPDGKRDGIV